MAYEITAKQLDLIVEIVSNNNDHVAINSSRWSCIMSIMRNDGIELRERASPPAVINMDKFEADLGRVASPPTSPA